MNLESIPQYAEVLTTIKKIWETVKLSEQQEIILLEGPSGMNKTQVVLSFLEESKATFIRSRGTGVPSPYLPFHMAYQSIFDLDKVQQFFMASNPNHLAIEEQRLLKALISTAPFLQPVTVPQVALSHQWQTFYQSTLQLDISSDVEDHIPLPRPITLPNRLALTLSELAAVSPIVFFLDDIDLVDDSSLDALSRELLPTLQSRPIFFLFAFDSSSLAENKSLSRFIEHTTISFSTEHLKLPLLRDNSIMEIAKAEFAGWGRSIPDELISKIIYSTVGNLAQLQDILNWLLRRYQEHPQLIIKEIPAYDGLMSEQFSQLDRLQQEILKLASCQGRYFCAEVLAEILTEPSQLVLETLDKMSDDAVWVSADADLVIEQHPIHWYRFRGQKRGEWTYRIVPVINLPTYHGQTGLAFESIYGRKAKDIAGLIAVQFEKAKNFFKAAEYFSILANQANLQGDSNSALFYAEKGLNYIQGDKNYQELICHLTTERGKAFQRSEKAYLAIDILQEARQLAIESNLEGEILVDIDCHLGQAFLDSNRLDIGIEVLSQAIEQTITRNEWFRTAQILESLRVAMFKKGDGSFIDMCDSVIGILEKQNTDLSRVAAAEILEDKGWFCLERSDTQLAIQTFTEAFTALSNVQERQSYPEVFYKLHRWQASALQSGKDFPAALISAQNAIEWAISCARRDYEAEAHMLKAAIFFDSGRLEDAQESHKIALRLLEFSSSIDKLAQAESAYGEFLSNTGDKTQALKYYQSSYEHSVQANNHLRAQIARNNLASISKQLGMFSAALANYQQLINEGIAQQDIGRQIVSINHIGDIYRVKGYLAESEKSHSHALQLCDRMSKLKSKLVSLRYLTRAYMAALKYTEAKIALDQFYDLHFKIGGADRTYHRSRMYEFRLDLFSSASQKSFDGLVGVIANLEEFKDYSWLGLAYLNLGLYHLLRGELQQSLSQTRSALLPFEVVSSWMVSDVHQLLARCHLAMGNLEEAHKEAAEAKARFIRLQLYHRVTETEIIETAIEIAQESKDWQQWREFTILEFEQNFKYVGL